jgi:hypothetical protein
VIRQLRETVAFLIAPWLRDQRREWNDIAEEWRKVADGHRRVAAGAEEIQQMGRALLEEASR